MSLRTCNLSIGGFGVGMRSMPCQKEDTRVTILIIVLALVLGLISYIELACQMLEEFPHLCVVRDNGQTTLHVLA